MPPNSWIHLTNQDPAYELDPLVRESDEFAGRDCGWVEQMRPFIRQFSKPGELVLDPFAGFGTTLLAAGTEGRRALGFEIEPSRVELARKRVPAAEIRCGTCLALRQPVDLILTSVPYFGSGYTGTGGTLQLYSAETYADYWEQMDEILRTLKTHLRPGRFLIAMAENIRLPDGGFVPLAWDLARAIGRRLELCDERLIVYAKPHSAPGLFPLHTNRSHEYAIVARKPDRGIAVDDARAILAELAKTGVSFTVIGSLAAMLQGDPVEAHDIDIAVAFDSAAVNLLLESLLQSGYAITCWQDPVTLPVRLEDYRGRYYFRADKLQRDGRKWRVDVNFEVESL